MSDFINILIRLADYKVDYVLVGGLAAAAHGCSLVTQDVDVCLDFAQQNLLRLQTALQDLHPVHRLTTKKIPFEHSPEELVQFKNLYLATDWGVLDCLGTVMGLGEYSTVRAISHPMEFGGRQCPVLTVDALITAKAAMGRPKDFEAIRQLRRIQEAPKPEA